jgi:RNA polymerase primary sigma factor
MGLIKAAEKFDPDKGYHFISYAVWWIRQAIMLAISQKTSLVRIPLNRTADLQRIEKVHKQLESQLGREPTAEEISESMDMDGAEVQYLKNLPQDFISLDATLGDSDDTTLVSNLEDERGDSPDKEILQKTLTRELNAILETLTKSEREIIRMRFGLGGTQPMSLQQIGEKFGLSKERIRQIEKKALRKLNALPDIRNLESYMND